MTLPTSGYRELPHTADWALEVWAPDEAGLLATAARGMYALMGVVWQSGPRVQRRLVVRAPDAESRLVDFLGELLYRLDQEGLAFDQLEMAVSGTQVVADLVGGSLGSITKEIKAVTYHNLVVRRTARGLETVIVFDV
jgi:SHS2 domain-containing protein